jgi:hypothetical protein
MAENIFSWQKMEKTWHRVDFCGKNEGFLCGKSRDDKAQKLCYADTVESVRATKGGRDCMAKNKVFVSETDCKEKLSAYFDTYLPASGEVADIEGLADFLGTTRSELIALTEHKSYGKLLRHAGNRIAKIKKQLAFRGKLPAAVLSFDLKNNHGYKDRPEEQTQVEGVTVVFRGKAEEWAK